MVQGEFVGPRRELAYLRGWLTAAAEGQPRLVLCGGEPGIGKTRLASELAKVAAASYGAGVVWARASEDGGAPPFWLWRQAELHSMTGGNPFFVREVARNLAASAGGDVMVPASVTGLISARVERLSPLTRRLLGAAAVLGEQFAAAIVASLIDQPVMACMQLFEEAKDSGLLEAAATAGEWRFAHGLVRNAVEASLSIAEKVDLHRMAAQAIERTYAGHLAPRLDEDYAVSCHRSP